LLNAPTIELTIGVGHLVVRSTAALAVHTVAGVDCDDTPAELRDRARVVEPGLAGLILVVVDAVG
jgi:hypothetical protein